MKRVFSVALTAVRWWCGLTYLALGPIGLIWGPIELIRGDAGGILILIGAAEVAVVGWLIHPWGLQRGRQPDAAARRPRSWLPVWLLPRRMAAARRSSAG